MPVASLNVNVLNFPGPDWAAWVTMVVAMATLVGVFVQIYLARREVHAVQEDLGNSREQMKEFMRRPDLTVSATQVNGFQKGQTANPQIPQPDYISSAITLSVRNTGSRATLPYMLEFLTPLDSTIYRGGGGKSRKVDDIEYVVVQWIQNELTLFPNANSHEYLHVHRMKPEIKNFTCLYRVYDTYATYPLNDYGILELTTKVST